MKKLLTAIFFLTTFVTANVFAQESACTYVNGQITSRSTCRIEPEKLIIKIYKIGVCSHDPYQAGRYSNSPDFRSCQTVFESSSGSTVTISNKNGTSLDGQFSRPWGGTYPYSYVILSPDMAVQASVTFSSSVTVSDGSSTGAVCWTKQATMWALAADTTGLVECGASRGASYGTMTTSYNTLGGSGAFLNEFQFYSSYWSLRQDHPLLLLSTQPTTDSGYGDIARFVSINTGAVTFSGSSRTLDLGFSVARAGRVKFDSSGNLKYIKNGDFEMRLLVN